MCVLPYTHHVQRQALQVALVLAGHLVCVQMQEEVLVCENYSSADQFVSISSAISGASALGHLRFLGAEDHL